MRSPVNLLHVLAATAASSAALLAQVPNDDCTGAFIVSNGLNGPYTNVGATTSSVWPCAAGANDVWFAYISGAAGSLTVSTCTLATYDSCIEILSGTCGSPTSLACNDDACGTQSTVTATLPAAGTYLIRVGGWQGDTGTFSLNVTGPGGPSGSVVATNTALGTGCIRAFNSFYQFFADAAQASTTLSAGTLLLSPTGTGYQGTWLAGTASAFFVPPVAGVPLATADDGVVTYTLSTGPLSTPQGPQTSVLVSGNAIVAWGGAGLNYPGTNSYTPAANALLNSTLGGIYAWHDYNVTEAGSGQILAEEVGGILYITFNGVESYPTGIANPSTLQFQFDVASGMVKICFVSVDSNTASTYGSAHAVGVSAPGPSQDPGSVDFLTATAAQLLATSPEVLPLSLAATSRPVTGTTWGLSVSNIPATGLIGVDVIGLADPGINDLSFLGAPTCGLRASLDVTLGWVVTGATHPYSLPIPSNPALLNLNLHTTSAVFQVPQVNALGAITSNGIRGTVGDL
ncbi:MAG: hypothetical protein ACK595_17805 [Planctomycetota bacterium]|jgi:hypothetical protein